MDEISVEAICPAKAPLLLPGEAQQAIGLNAYYLLEEATRARRAEQPQSAVLEEVLSKAKLLGVRFLRVAGFNDDPKKIGDSALQIAPLQYDALALEGFDLLLARSAAHGVRLILTLSNYWDAFGGVRQYVAWAGLPRPKTGDARFFTDLRIREHYKRHIETLLQRRNRIDGIRYGDHPAVLAWELVNEARGEGLDRGGQEMRAWIDDIAAHIKALAPGHSVGTGEEGLDVDLEGYDADFWKKRVGASWMFKAASSFRLNLASPHIDYASIHLYPEAWGIPGRATAAAGAQWITEHAELARQAGKPLLLGEFGLRNRGNFDLAERRDIYRQWLSCARRNGAGGAAPWLFANDDRTDDWDAFTFNFRDGTAVEDPVNRYADLVRDAALGSAASVDP